MDTFELKPNGQIDINRVSLTEVIRKAELPAATAEFDERTANGETGIYNLAGDYIFFGPRWYYLPNRNLLDQPVSLAGGFVIPEDDPRRQKATVLGCTCGVSECWFLLVRISLEKSIVRWSEFEQFHRDWQYDLEFVFDRSAYEAQLQPPVS